MLDDEQRLEEINDKLFELIVELCDDDTHSPYAIAGVLMAQGMRMNKTMLDEEEFSRLMAVIWECKDQLNRPEEIVLH